MQWTRQKTTWLGTDLEKRGRWHGIPYTIRGVSPKGMTREGRVVVILAGLVLLALVMVIELLV